MKKIWKWEVIYIEKGTGGKITGVPRHGGSILSILSLSSEVLNLFSPPCDFFMTSNFKNFFIYGQISIKSTPKPNMKSLSLMGHEQTPYYIKSTKLGAPFG